MFSIDNLSVDLALKDLQLLVSDAQTHSAKEFHFRSFQSKNHAHRIAAVDGSHHNLKGVNFVLSFLRAGYMLYQHGNVIDSSIDPIKFELITNNNSYQTGFEYKHEKYFQTITTELPNGKLEYDKVTERIRTLMEWEKIHQLIDQLDQNDIIIFDGSLISGEISTSHDFFNRLVCSAKEKGISLVGLSKDTSLSIDSVSLPLVLMEAANKSFKEKNWFVSYENTHFVKFTNNKDLIFRIDTVLPDHLSFEELLSRIGAYCFDVATYGYPYPMQAIHDEVRISELDRDQCFDYFKSYCLRAQVPSSFIDKLFSIYHDQLDKISFGR